MQSILIKTKFVIKIFKKKENTRLVHCFIYKNRHLAEKNKTMYNKNLLDIAHIFS